MEIYYRSPDEPLDETANGMVELAYYTQDEVGVVWDDDIVIATPDDTTDDVLTKFEDSTRKQALAVGTKNAKARLEPKYPNYPDYMDGYNSANSDQE